MANFKWMKIFIHCLIFLGISLSSTKIIAAPSLENETVLAKPSIASNPAAVNELTGTADLQKYIEKKLGITNNYGIRIGGTFVGDANDLFSGGIPHADRWTLNGLLLLDLSLQTKELLGWKGGLFDIQFMQFNGQNTNQEAGTVQGYNSLPGPSPLNRFEIYQLWFRQVLLEDKLIVRIGKSVPTFNFGNVIKPLPLNKHDPNIPAVTALIFTPIFVNAAMLGVMPGYYNSAYGITLNIIPIKKWYVSLGAYDGNLAQGKQLGLTGPNFNGNYFYIAETGFAWLLDQYHKPGYIGIGAWQQSGLIQNTTLKEHNAQGFYVFGSQRLWYKNPHYDSSGISGFYQYGQNNSTVLAMSKYVGAGFTAFGLIPNRASDSMGIGTAFSWLNQRIFHRRTEWMLQAYYQAPLAKDIYIEPVLSYIPTPAARPNLNAAWAGTLRMIVLF